MLEVINLVCFSYSNNDQCAGYAIAEIGYIPSYELFSGNKERAEKDVQLFYTEFIAGLFRSVSPNTFSFEIIFHSVPVKNQTYSAQVKMYFVVRQLGQEKEKIEFSIISIMSNLKNDFESRNYSFDILDSEYQYKRFFNEIRQTDNSCTTALSKNEKVFGNVFAANGGLYFNDVIEPNECINVARITNVMTQFPNATVSLQIIPTNFTDYELAYFKNGRAGINYSIGNIRIRQGMQPIDAFTMSVANAFDYYCEAADMMVAYGNLIVYSSKSASVAICNKIISTIENESVHSGSIKPYTINNSKLSPCDNFAIGPWLNSNILVYNERPMDFWNQKYSPRELMRLKYIFSIQELKSIFKFPFDDDTVIGLEVRKFNKNREKFNTKVTSDDNFKLGIIQNSSLGNSDKLTYAGVPIDDFTMHGLIVGTPGSGKTYFSLGLLVQMWDKFNIPFLAVEPTKSEYRSLIDIIPELQVFTPGKSNISPFIINPFIPPKNVTVESYVSSLVTAFNAAFSMPSPLPDIFLSAINECYNEYGWKMNSTSDDPQAEKFGMYEFIRVFKRKVRNSDYKGDVKSNIESAGVVRLVSLLEQNSNIYDTINTIPLDDLLTKPTVIELNAINNKEQKSLVMAFLLSLICTHVKNNPNTEGHLRNTMLIDEAHVILGDSSKKDEFSADAVGSTVSTLEDMIAEVRACGMSIIIADQSPEKVGKGIVGNTNVKVVFRLVEKSSKDIIKNAINLSELDYERLGTLGMGEAILYHGKVIEPLNIKTFKTFTDKSFRKVISDAELAPLCKYWDDKSYLLIPHKECYYNNFCKGYCDAEIKNNADFIATRIVNLYFSRVTSTKDLISLLWVAEKPIIKLLNERHIKAHPKLVNCIKIKILRKFMISKSFDISPASYTNILKHKNFIGWEEN